MSAVTTARRATGLVFFAYSLNLIYEFWIHTEHIDRMWAPFEYVFNTPPSHHRVHHGRDPEYLDRNYGGVFIIWDRMFGSFTPEVRRPRYGLTKPVDTYNIWTLETHEYASIARDVKSTTSWRARVGYIFGPPGWRRASADTIPNRRCRSARPDHVSLLPRAMTSACADGPTGGGPGLAADHPQAENQREMGRHQRR